MGSGKLSLVRSSSRSMSLYIITFNTMWKAGTDEDLIFRVLIFQALPCHVEFAGAQPHLEG